MRRVRLSRAKFWRMPPNTVKVDRTTPWGNFALPAGTKIRTREQAAEAVALFRAWLADHPEQVTQAQYELAGKALACWCRED